MLKGNLFPTATLKVAFYRLTKVGKGAKHFDVEEPLARSGAYTVDGGGVENWSFENFNAALGEYQNRRH